MHTSSHSVKVIALIVTYNRKELLQECLDSVLNQTVPVDAILVVDNASTDGTSELFENGKYSEVGNLHYCNIGTNLGGAGGFKFGLEIASAVNCDYVWLMDDDCIPNPTALEKLLESLDHLPEKPSFLASAVYGPEGEPMNVPKLSSRTHSNGYQDWYRYTSFGLVEIERATFVSLLIDVEAIKHVGLPIGSYFIWGDDIEYTNRLAKYHAPGYLCSCSTVVHKRQNARSLNIRNETDPTRLRNYRLFTRNQLVNCKYYRGRWVTFLTMRGRIAECLELLLHNEDSFALGLMRSRSVFLGIMDFILGKYDIEDLGLLLGDD